MTTPSATCRAPHVALRLSPDGHAHACCVNDQYPLGDVREQTLREIWEGEALARLRAALDDADWSLGCTDCGVEYEVGQRLQTHAEQFDRFPQPATPLPWPKRVEFALSNTCNLQCIHCNGDLSSAIRAQREHRPPLRSAYDDAFFDQLREVLPHLEVAVFIGGEPFLAREARRVWDLMIELDVHPEVHVTTNATVWDERVERYLRALRMNVAVSVDGHRPGTNEAIRAGSEHREVVRNRDRLLAATRSYGGAFALNHCLMTQNWTELSRFLRRADRLDVPVHVIPVMYPRSMSLFALPPEELAPIVERLRGDRVARRLRRNRPAWDASLAHLEKVLAEPRAVAPAPEPQPVAIRSRPTPDLVAELRAELEAWAGQDLLELRTDGTVVSSATAPAWAQPLGLSALEGRPLALFEERCTELLGPAYDQEQEPAGPGVVRIRHHRRVGEAQVTFRAALLPGWGLLTATDADLRTLVG